MKRKKSYTFQQIDDLKDVAWQQGRTAGFNEGMAAGKRAVESDIHKRVQDARREALTKLVDSLARIADAAAHLVGEVGGVQ